MPECHSLKSNKSDVAAECEFLRAVLWLRLECTLRGGGGRERQRQQVEEAILEIGRSHQNTSSGGSDSNQQLVCHSSRPAQVSSPRPDWRLVQPNVLVLCKYIMYSKCQSVLQWSSHDRIGLTAYTQRGAPRNVITCVRHRCSEAPRSHPDRSVSASRSIQPELVPGKFTPNQQDAWHITHPTGCEDTHANGTSVTQIAHFNNLLISDAAQTPPEVNFNHSENNLHRLVIKPYLNKYAYSYCTSTYLRVYTSIGPTVCTPYSTHVFRYSQAKILGNVRVLYSYCVWHSSIHVYQYVQWNAIERK